jgi:nitroreductase/Pyruvate/2-oxoacid:ferredoxin oxidoreductase delta subunit
MITMEVDKKTCAGDGKCVEVCPLHLLKMNEKEHVPEFIPEGGAACINCGHCFAFCPHGSIRLSTMDSKYTVRLDHGKLPYAQQIELFLKGRRSIRKYKDEPMTKESMEKLLDISRFAPSGINRQPVSWVVVMGKDKVHELSGLIVEWIEELLAAKNQMAVSFRFDRLSSAWKNGEDLICRGAPCIVIAYGIKDDPMVPQSCTIAATYLELAAFGLGFGACWAGYVNMAINMSEKIRKFVGLSSHATVGAVMMIGHPKYRYSRLPLRNPVQVSWK